MLQIRYDISSIERDKLKAAQPSTLDEASLRYYFTWGQIRLNCDREYHVSLTFDAPVLDFAYSLSHIAFALDHSEKELLEFTESEATFVFDRRENLVRISSNFSDWSCECTLSQLQEVSREFLKSVLDDLCQTIPELSINPIVQTIQGQLL